MDTPKTESADALRWIAVIASVRESVATRRKCAETMRERYDRDSPGWIAHDAEVEVLSAVQRDIADVVENAAISN